MFGKLNIIILQNMLQLTHNCSIFCNKKRYFDGELIKIFKYSGVLFRENYMLYYKEEF